MACSKSVNGSSDEWCDILCEPCRKAQQNTTADGFCVDCSEYLCGQCYHHHIRFKQFEHHVLQDKNSMPLDPKHTVLKYVCTSKCQVHVDKVIEYFCKSCDKIGCSVCMTVDHRSCDGVRYIPDEVKKADTSLEIHEFVNMIDDMIEEQTKLYVKIDQNFQVSDEMNKTACNDIERQKYQIATFFENLYDNIKTEIVGKQDADKKVFKTLLKEISIMQTDLANRKARLQTLEQGHQICEAFIFMKYTQAAMGKMSSDMKELSENGKEKTARYERSLDVEELKEDIKCLGRLLTGESDHVNKIESVKKKMEKELHMIRREKEDLKDVLDRTNAIAKGLKKNVTELQSRVQKEEQNNKHLKTEKENQKLDYESRLKEEQERHKSSMEMILRIVQEGFAPPNRFAQPNKLETPHGRDVQHLLASPLKSPHGRDVQHLLASPLKSPHESPHKHALSKMYRNALQSIQRFAHEELCKMDGAQRP